MYTSRLENQLILPDIVDQMTQFVPIQSDIDPERIKAASIIAQNIDIKRIIGKDNLSRVIYNGENEIEGSDYELLQLIIAPLCYYTYSRLLLMFQGNYTDSGLEIDQQASARNEAKSISNEMKAVAETFMQEVIEFLQEENPQSEVNEDKLTPQVQSWGGKECRASN